MVESWATGRPAESVGALPMRSTGVAKLSSWQRVLGPVADFVDRDQGSLKVILFVKDSVHY